MNHYRTSFCTNVTNRPDVRALRSEPQIMVSSYWPLSLVMSSLCLKVLGVINVSPGPSSSVISSNSHATVCVLSSGFLFYVKKVVDLIVAASLLTVGFPSALHLNSDRIIIRDDIVAVSLRLA